MPVPTGHAALRVLASGSAGNCSVLIIPTPHDAARPRRVVLIDAGLSPRRTARLLETDALTLGDLTDLCLTHLDHDHAHPGWARPDAAPHAVLRLHRAHLGRARRAGLLHRRTEPIDDAGADLAPGLRLRPLRMAHDDLGVTAYRLHLDHLGRDIGFATDLGRATDALTAHLAGVDLLAIESNYCPRLQMDSPRPAFLKRRIMGGAGHLSNQEAAEAVRAIAPREHVVFLHLSRECNAPERVAALHQGADYAWTISSQHEPTRWITLAPAAPRAAPRPRPAPVTAGQHALFPSMRTA